MTERQRPQDPVPPGYQEAPAEPAFQSYQPYPSGDPNRPLYPAYPAHPGYPPGHYPAYQPQGVAPPSYLAWAIVSIVLFWPIGIAAIIKSTQVDKYWAAGQQGLAEHASRTTRTLCLVTTIVAVAVIVLWLVLFFLIFASMPLPPG